MFDVALCCLLGACPFVAGTGHKISSPYIDICSAEESITLKQEQVNLERDKLDLEEDTLRSCRLHRSKTQ